MVSSDAIHLNRLIHKSIKEALETLVVIQARDFRHVVVRAHNQDSSYLRIDAKMLVTMAMTVIEALLVDEGLVYISHSPFAADWPEVVVELLLLHVGAVSGEHDDRFDKAVDIGVLRCESTDWPLQRVQVLGKLWSR